MRCLPQKVTQGHLLDVLEPAIARSLRTVGHANLERATAQVLVNTQVLRTKVDGQTRVDALLRLAKCR